MGAVGAVGAVVHGSGRAWGDEGTGGAWGDEGGEGHEGVVRCGSSWAGRAVPRPWGLQSGVFHGKRVCLTGFRRSVGPSWNLSSAACSLSTPPESTATSR
ncbi:hypothetical protein GCM10010254_09710 [Streptomyces chromofuscus]|nr:hypothetical protein GCM10010254_09710 [Streptomyces chromofuscus]